MTPGDGAATTNEELDGPRTSGARRAVLGGAAALALVLAVLGTWLAVDVLRVRSALNTARDLSSELSQQVGRSEGEEIAATARELGRAVSTARQISDSRLWSLGTWLPVVGHDFAVVAEATSTLEPVAVDGVPGLTALAARGDQVGVQVRNGRVNLGAIRRLAPQLERSAEIFTEGQSRFSRIDVANAHGPVRSALREAAEKLDQAQAALSKGAEVLRRAPDMLGATSPRRYLLVFQNNAELRSTGGIPGAYAEIAVNDGVVSIRRQGEGSGTGFFDPPALPMTADEKALYGTLPGNFWVDTNFSPHFPRTADLLRAMYRTRFDQRIDGVISVDPVALSRILRVTGPVRVTEDVLLTSENVVAALLNRVYTSFPDDDDAQNKIFNTAARAIFTTFVAGRAEIGPLINELRAATQEGRIIVNATNPIEQRLFERTLLAGELPTDPGPVPHLGLYVNDSSASKLGFYLKRDTTVRAVSCGRDGTQVFEVTTTLDYRAPRKVTDLGPGVVGYTAGAEAGHLSMVLSYYAPVGGTVTAMAVDSQERSVNRKTYRGLELATVPVELAPGASQVLTVTVRSGPGQEQDGVFRTTPGIQVSPNNVPVPTAC